MNCSMSIEQKLCQVKIFQLQSMFEYVECDKMYRSKVCIQYFSYFVSWYSTWKIRVLQSCTRKNLLQVAKYDDSYYVFFEKSIRTHGLVVNVSRRESGDMGSNPEECWNALQRLGHFAWHWARQCTDKRAFYLAALSIIFFSWISSVAISRWQS